MLPAEEVEAGEGGESSIVSSAAEGWAVGFVAEVVLVVVVVVAAK